MALEDILASTTTGQGIFDCGYMDVMRAKVALEVVKAASTIVQNDIGSSAADLLAKAFQSQDIPVKEPA